MVISFATDTVTVIRPAYLTSRGDQVPDWDHATEHDSTGWRIQPLAGEEVLTGRDAVVDRRKGFGPIDADVNERDRIRFAGLLFEIDSPIQRWRSPTGTIAHTEITLRRVEG